MPLPPPSEPSPEAAAAPFRGWLPRRLLAWFAAHSRDLPWRRDRDPYHIWVSEVMLQQTQVATVVPYFERFLTAFPTLPALAAASEQDVLRLWEGLGYYRRARALYRAAQRLVQEHGGTLPDDPEVVSALPGLGRYTCNAILSQAFDRRLPILEANTLRLLSRLFGRRDDPRRGPANRWLWDAAAALLPQRRVGAFNQALMELGALVCTPTEPRCDDCPAAARCVARQLGIQREIPARALKAEVIRVREVAVVVRRGDTVLIVQRPADAVRWAGLWEFPHAAVAADETDAAAALRIARKLTGLTVRLGPELLTVRHGVTRHAITLVAFEAEHRQGEFRSTDYAQGVWLHPSALAEFPVSAPQRRLADALMRAGRQQRLF